MIDLTRQCALCGARHPKSESLLWVDPREWCGDADPHGRFVIETDDMPDLLCKCSRRYRPRNA